MESMAEQHAAVRVFRPSAIGWFHHAVCHAMVQLQRGPAWRAVLPAGHGSKPATPPSFNGCRQQGHTERRILDRLEHGPRISSSSEFRSCRLSRARKQQRERHNSPTAVNKVRELGFCQPAERFCAIQEMRRRERVAAIRGAQGGGRR